MKKTVRRILSITMLFILIFSMSANVFAANVCSNVSGNTKKAKAFVVATEGRFLLADKITLTQSTGKMETGFTFQNGDIYWAYEVKIQKLMSGTDTITTTVKWNYTKNLTIKLDKNARYRIIVTPVDESAVILHYGLRKLSDTILSYPTWWVSSTSGISSCALSYYG